jgi:hypothetical protein
MKKRYLFLLVTLSVFAFSKAQSNFGFGFRVNQAVMQKITSATDNNAFFATDYTAFIQYRSVGFFGGITALNNYKTAVITDGQHIECLNAGLFFKLGELHKNASLSLNLYNVHFFSAIYFQTINFIGVNPQYRYSFLNNTVALEAGVSLSLIHDNFTYINSYLRPAIGANLSLSFNIVPLFAKKPTQ